MPHHSARQLESKVCPLVLQRSVKYHATALFRKSALDAGAIDGTIETPSLNSAAIGGATGTGIPFLNFQAVSGGAMGTGMLSLNSGAISGGATPHPYGGAMGTGIPSLNSGAVSGGATPECTATGTPSYGGATGTGMPSLITGAVSGGVTLECTATGTPSYGGAMGTGMPSLNSRAISGGATPHPYGGAMGTPSLNSGAVSGGATPECTATGTPSYGGATGTGMPSLNSRAGGAMPSSIEALNMTEDFVPSAISPQKHQTAEEVMHTFSRFKNRRDVGRLAIVLAKYTYFGHDLMACSTTTGRKGTKALDNSRLQQL